jgi:hypothetical protein
MIHLEVDQIISIFNNSNEMNTFEWNRITSRILLNEEYEIKSKISIKDLFYTDSKRYGDLIEEKHKIIRLGLTKGDINTARTSANKVVLLRYNDSLYQHSLFKLNSENVIDFNMNIVELLKCISRARIGIKRYINTLYSINTSQNTYDIDKYSKVNTNIKSYLNATFHIMQSPKCIVKFTKGSILDLKQKVESIINTSYTRNAFYGDTTSIYYTTGVPIEVTDYLTKENIKYDVIPCKTAN